MMGLQSPERSQSTVNLPSPDNDNSLTVMTVDSNQQESQQPGRGDLTPVESFLFLAV